MNRGIRQAWVYLLGSVLFISMPTYAAGLLTPTNSQLPVLEIKDHRVSVVIEDGYAITQVEQVFHNPHQQDLEARYSFPVPEKASVAEFTLWIDGKPVIGEVLEKKQARQIYEEEKQAGRDAGLTEQDGYETFEVSVAPVRAQQDTRVRLVYFQPAQVDTGIGRFVYPLEEGGVDDHKLAFWTANDKVSGHFQFSLKLKSAYPVDAVRVPNAQAQIRQLGQGEWEIVIEANNATGPALSGATQQHDDIPASNPTASPALAVSTVEEDIQGTQVSPPARSGTPSYRLDKDIVVYWRHTPGLPGSVDLITHKPDAGKRGTFMLVVTPGEDLQAITEGRDWVFVLDVSGSMQGKYATLADGVSKALQKLKPEDRFRIVLFNNTARELTQGFTPATPEMVNQYIQSVSQVHAGGSTNMYAGLGMGLNSLDSDRTSAIFLVTDGVANVGITQQKKFIELIKQKDIRLFTAIMGNSANRPLLQALTRHSNGFAVNISNSDDIVGQVLKFQSKVTHQALHGVQLEIDGIKTADVTPRHIGSLYRGQQLVLMGHYWGSGEAQVKLSGKLSGTPKVYQTRFNFPSQTTSNPEIERLWAYAAIDDMLQEMDDFGERADLKQGVIDLATEYSLVTDYTSMLVVREEVFASRGINRANQQRRATEQTAAQQRAQQPAQNRRVDQQQPMYQGSRPSFGGGAWGVETVLIMVALSVLIGIRRQRQSRAIRA